MDGRGTNTVPTSHSKHDCIYSEREVASCHNDGGCCSCCINWHADKNGKQWVRCIYTPNDKLRHGGENQ